CCDNTAPMATPEASVVRSKGLVKSGRARVMREAIASFNLEKAVAARGFHLKEGCLRRSGLENKLEMLIVLLYGGVVNQDVVKKKPRQTWGALTGKGRSLPIGMWTARLVQAVTLKVMPVANHNLEWSDLGGIFL
nr:hypothetical protein [Tanacetum cinerariifolium]